MGTIYDLLNPTAYNETSRLFTDVADTLDAMAAQCSQTASYGFDLLSSVRWAIASLPLQPTIFIDPSGFFSNTLATANGIGSLSTTLLAEARQMTQIATLESSILQMLMNAAGSPIDAAKGLLINGQQVRDTLVAIPAVVGKSVSSPIVDAFIGGAADLAKGKSLDYAIKNGLGSFTLGAIPVVGETIAALKLTGTAGDLEGQGLQWAGRQIATSDQGLGTATYYQGMAIQQAGKGMDDSLTKLSVATGSLIEHAAVPFMIGMAASGGDPLGGLAGVAFVAAVDPTVRDQLSQDAGTMIRSTLNAGHSFVMIGSDLTSQAIGGSSTLVAMGLEQIPWLSPFRNDIAHVNDTINLGLAMASYAGPLNTTSF